MSFKSIITNPLQFLKRNKDADAYRLPAVSKTANPPPSQAATPLNLAKRMYAGAAVNRLTGDQVWSIININRDIQSSLRILKARSRQLAKDNSYFKSFINKSERNILGPDGIKLQMRVTDDTGAIDSAANTELEEAWEDWGRAPSVMSDWSDPYCVQSNQSWLDVQRLVVRSWKIDGSAIVRRFRGWQGNPYAFAIQVLDSNSLDFWYNAESTPNGNKNRIVMGVEINEYGCPVAYYFRSNTMEVDPSANANAKNLERIRVPASEISHIYSVDFPGQVVGVPVCSSAILNLNMLQGYSEAELVAARAAACKMGFYLTTKNGNEEGGDSVGEDGEMQEDYESGKMRLLPEGVDVKFNDPTHPNGNYGGFVKSQLREVAAGLGVAYNSLANDLENVNFSSMRAGSLEERDGWKLDQAFLVEKLCVPTFSEWLMCYLALSGKSKLPFKKFTKFNRPNFRPRVFPWVDPAQDTMSNLTLMSAGMKPPQIICSEQGGDLYESIDDYAEAIKYAKEKGVPINFLMNPKSQQAATANTNNATDTSTSTDGAKPNE